MNIKVKIGLAGAVHPNMPGNDREIYQNIINSMDTLKDELGFDFVYIKEPLCSENDGENARRFFDNENVDLTMVITPSLGYGRVILPLARVKSFLGLWALPEPVHSGKLQLNSFCGLNMYSAIIDSYLNGHDIPFKWFYDYPETELFRERFIITLKAMKAIKAVRNSRIALIGDVADGFENFIFDERALQKKFDTTYLYTRHSVEDIIDLAEGYSDECINEYLVQINKEGTWRKDRVSANHMEKFARINKALEDFAKEHNYNALAVNCWPTFQKYYDIAPCAAFSRLNNMGIVTTCEGDVPGAINMIMMNAISDTPACIMDLVDIDESDNTACLWHCGPAPAGCANECGVRWDEHFNIGNYDNCRWCGKGVVADLSFKAGAVTIARIDSTFEKFFVWNADVATEKKGYEGSSGWLKNISIDDEAVDTKNFINTLIVNRIDHHFPMAYGNMKNELYEVAAWLGLKVAKTVPYKPYMQNPIL